MELKSRFPFDVAPEVIRAAITDEKSIAYIVERHPEIASLEILKNKEQGEKVFLDLLDLVNIIDSPHGNEFTKLWETVADPAPTEGQGAPDRADGECEDA